MATAPLAIKLDDEDSERVRRSHSDGIVELQGLPFARAKIVSNVQLADGIKTPVPHRLGRVAVWTRESIVRGATSTGRIVETRDGSADPTQFVVLTATGWGATITVDLVVL